MSAEGPLRDGRETGFHLIETMRREPETGIVRLDLHRQRLENSAQTLGFSHDRQRIDAAFAALPPSDEPQRIRLTLAQDGLCAIEAFPFQPMPEDTVWTVRIASARLDSTDPLLRHKTSRRHVYEAARAEFSPEEAQEVLLLNERGEVCEGVITNLFIRIDDGPLHTPPLSSGVLAGTLRRELLLAGKAREAVLYPADLIKARQIFVGNSLRGLISVTLATNIPR